MPIWTRQSFLSGGWHHCLFSEENGSWNNLNSVTYHTCIKEHLCYHGSITIRNHRMPSCRRSRLFRPLHPIALLDPTFYMELRRSNCSSVDT